MPIEHSPTSKAVTRSDSFKASSAVKRNVSIPISPHQTVISKFNISLSPIKTLNTNLKPTPHISNRSNIAKMSISLGEIAKLAKLVGDYNVDCTDVSIRSHLIRLETLATIGQWDNGVKISVTISTLKGRAFDHISDTTWTQYKDLKLALISKFDSLDDVASLTNQLFNIKQKSASIREHATSFDIILNKLKSIGAVPLSPQTLLNVFLDGLLFKYKRDILLQGISNYDDALKRAVLLERLDTTETVGKVVAELACNQSSASSAVELENTTGTFTNFKTMESSVNELIESVAALTLRDSFQGKSPNIQNNLANNDSNVKDDTNQSQNYNNNSRVPNKFNNKNNNQQRPNNQQGQMNNYPNSNYHGSNFDPNYKYNRGNQQRPRFNNSNNQQKNFNNQNGSNQQRQSFSNNNNQNQYNRGRGFARSNYKGNGNFSPTCFFCGKQGHFSTSCFANPNSDQYRPYNNNFRANNNNSYRPSGQNVQQYGQQQQQQPIYVQMPMPQGYQQAAIQAPSNQNNVPNIQYIPVVQKDIIQDNTQRQNSGN
jgi:hypothetical protein